MSFSLVVVAYNRPREFQALLTELACAHFDQIVDLIITIDFSDDQATMIRIAEAYNWSFGNKQVVVRTEQFGLKRNILESADLGARYDKFILLEEDLVVSPYFFSFAQEALQFYAHDPKIAGVSLYSYDTRESDRLPFYPIHEGGDSYFMQFPSSWGQAWTKQQWYDFRAWLVLHDCDHFVDARCPDFVQLWPARSWKKHYVRYLCVTDKYVVYPHIGLSSNSCSNGSHHNFIGQMFSTRLLYGDKAWHFNLFSSAEYVYRADFAMLGPLGADGTRDLKRSLEFSNNYKLRDLSSFYNKYPFNCLGYAKLAGMALVNDSKKILFKMRRRFF